MVGQQEELAVILKALGAKDTTDALKIVAQSIGSTAQASRTAASDWARFSNQTKALAASLSGKGVRQELAAIDQALKQLGGTSKIADPQLQKLGARLRELEAQGGKLSPALAKVANDTAGSFNVMGLAQDALGQSAEGLGGNLGGLGSMLGSLGPYGMAAAAGLGAAVGAVTALGTAFVASASALVEFSSALSDQSAETGLSVRQLQEYNYIAAVAGVSQQQLVDGIQRSGRVLAEGGAEAARAAQMLGLSFDALRKMGPEQQFLTIKNALDGVTSASQRLALIKDLGFTDPAMLRVFAQDINALKGEFEALDLAVPEGTINSWDAFGDELARMQVALHAFGTALAEGATGDADKSIAAMRELTFLIAELGSTVRETTPIVIDLFKSALGIPAKASIEDTVYGLRVLNAAIKATAVAAKSGFKDIKFEMPKQAMGWGSRSTDPRANALSDVGQAPLAPTPDQIKAAEERMKVYMDALRGGLAAFFNELAERRGAREARFDIFGQSAENVMIDVRRVADAWSELTKVQEPTPGQIDAATKAFTALKQQLTPEDWAAVREQVRGMGVDLNEFTQQVQTMSVRAKPLVADMAGAFDFSGATGGAARARIEEARRALQGQAEIQREITAELEKQLASGALTKDEYERLNAQLGTVRDTTIDWSATLRDVQAAFEVLGMSADSTFGSILGGFASAMAAAERFKAAQKQGGFSGAVGQGLAGLQAAGTAFQSGSALGGAATGAAFGFQVGGPIGAAIGGVAGGILGIFGGKAKIKKELAELREQLLSSVGGSMAELQKRASSLGVDISRAFSTKDPKELKRIVDDLNKAAEDQKKRWEGVQESIGGLSLRVHGFSAELLKSVGVDGVKSFDDLREQINEGTLAIGDLTGATERQQATFSRLGLFAVSTFSQYVRESGDVIGALREMETSLADLSTAQDAFGLSGSEAINQLLGLRDVVATNSAVAESIQGLNQLMNGLEATGLNNAQLFNSFGADASELFQQMIEGGASANQAMALMQPTLQKLWEHQQRFGDITDESTRSLLAQAESQGLVGENMKAVNEQILDVLIAMAEVLGAQIPAGLQRMGAAAEREFERFGNAAGAASGKIPSIPEGFAAGAVGGGAFGTGGELPGFANGGTVSAPLSGKPVIVHGTEHIIPTAVFERMIDAAVSRAVSSAARELATAGAGESIIVLDGERVGRTMRRQAETGRGTPRRGPMAPRRR